MARPFSPIYFRNFIFGVEDSLVSTVGLLSGIAIAGMDKHEIFITALVLIFVEAVSMSAGSFLSESSAEAYESRTDLLSARSYAAAGIMFISYFLSGFVPLAPYLLFSISQAFWISIGASVLALLLLGFVSGKLSRTGIWSMGLRMMLVGGLAILVGVTVGSLVS